jgi:hypothetical protein
MNPPFHPEADLEMARILREYAKIDPQLAVDLNELLNNGLDEIESHPRKFPIADDAPEAFEVRHFVLRRFRFRIVYWYDRSHPVVIAIAHLHREPGYWHDRLLDYV